MTPRVTTKQRGEVEIRAHARWSAGDSMSSTPPSLPPSLTQSAQSWRVLAPGPVMASRSPVDVERCPFL